jgi:hypothetical protein
VPRLRIHGGIPLLPLYASIGRAGTTLPFVFTLETWLINNGPVAFLMDVSNIPEMVLGGDWLRGEQALRKVNG